jgi:hypothetical protein
MTDVGQTLRTISETAGCAEIVKQLSARFTMHRQSGAVPRINGVI